MLRRVRITGVPKAQTGRQVQGSFSNTTSMMGNGRQDGPNVSKTLTRVPRNEANLEAEGGETVVGNLDGSNMPSSKTIKGPRHSAGGVPLNLPDDSFIFSDTRSMLITDPHILKMFNKPTKKGGYTPAELSKTFDLTKYRGILQDKDSDELDRKTAELMIKNYTLKLGALALVQESKKGFPQGIPEIAKPYMDANGIAEEDLIPPPPEQQQQMPQEQMQDPMMQEQMAQEMGDPNQAPMEMMQGDPNQMSQEMMLYGGHRRLKRAQEGIQQPSEEEMMMMQQQGQQQPQQQQGGDEMAQIMQQVQSALQEGTEPAEVVMSLLQNSVPPEAIVQIFTQLGASQEEATGLVQQAMSQGQESEQQQMAQYGMSMGGFYPEYAFGGDLPKAQTGRSRAKTEAELQKELREGKVTVIKKQKQPDGTIKITRADGSVIYAKGTSDGTVTVATPERKEGQRQTTDPTQYKKDICAWIGKTGITAQQAADSGRIHKSQIGNFTHCENLKKSEKDTSEFYEIDEASVDEKGDCLCTKSDGTTYNPGEDEKGNCLKCEESIPGEGIGAMAPPRRPASWWLQDTINTMGAFGDMMGARKYMPWGSRVDLEEPRPTFLDPTRELAAQSEQANIASQASATFAGPQGLAGRLAHTQGQGAAAAANTLSRYNNANVGIANQFEQAGVQARNQESAMNQAMNTRVYDKNTIANQQFDNTKRGLRGNTRLAYITARTNMAKTDALNQMYPNYQTDPSSGGFVNYTPTDKNLDPGQEDADARTFAHSIMKYPEGTQKLLWKQKYGKLGGQMFKHGGFVYTVYPE